MYPPGWQAFRRAWPPPGWWHPAWAGDWKSPAEGLRPTVLRTGVLFEPSARISYSRACSMTLGRRVFSSHKYGRKVRRASQIHSAPSSHAPLARLSLFAWWNFVSLSSRPFTDMRPTVIVDLSEPKYPCDRVWFFPSL